MQEAEVVTLCGSVRFAEEHLAAHRRLSLEGHIVLLPALPLSDDDSLAAHVEVLAALHRRKIDMSDRVHIVNPGGYVGEATASEVAYAEANGKTVTYEHSNTSPAVCGAGLLVSRSGDADASYAEPLAPARVRSATSSSRVARMRCRVAERRRFLVPAMAPRRIEPSRRASATARSITSSAAATWSR